MGKHEKKNREKRGRLGGQGIEGRKKGKGRAKKGYFATRRKSRRGREKKRRERGGETRKSARVGVTTSNSKGIQRRRKGKKRGRPMWGVTKQLGHPLTDK